MHTYYRSINLTSGWRFAAALDQPPGVCLSSDSLSADDLMSAGIEFREAVGPGGFERDLVAAGLIDDDSFFGMNIAKATQLESYSFYYICRFGAQASIGGTSAVLVFDGLDCGARVYLNGKAVGECSNMLVPQEYGGIELRAGENELVVASCPTLSSTAASQIGPGNFAQPQAFASARIRKAPHMYGWDIMPRVLSAGIWRPVRVEYWPDERLGEIYLATTDASEARATCALWYSVIGTDTNRARYEVAIDGVCGDSSFSARERLLGPAGQISFGVDNPRLWWPRGRGQANLYEVRIRLLNNGAEIDRRDLRHGMRTIELRRTEIIEENGSGEFVFIVNGERIFILGTSWVPLDAWHGRDMERLDQAMALLDEAGCNMVRCWGGNVYESDRFFDMCDERGVLVWQDFAMACAVYPQDGAFAKAIEGEARQVVRRIRNHPCLALWCGDNECDVAGTWGPFTKNTDPNDNRLTREVLPRVLRDEDPLRPYLPSSPYVGKLALGLGEAKIPEQHLWGPRRYYKAPFYRDSLAVFASEIGYQGSPTVESIKRFITEEKIWPIPNDEWLLHATSPIPGVDLFDYRIELMRHQIGDLFGCKPQSIHEFSCLSQCVQAEAKKFFIETFRSQKWRKTGIIWWNLLDGWPQFSDAVVDYYFAKKLAFDLIVRAQKPLHLVIGEPDEAGTHALVACNDTRDAVPLSFSVRAVSIGGVELTGEATAAADAVTTLGQIHRCSPQEMYVIDWQSTLGTATNHYLAGAPPFDSTTYLRWLAIAYGPAVQSSLECAISICERHAVHQQSKEAKTG